MRHLPRIVLTLGDPNGIGPEVVLKALTDAEIRHKCEVIVVGSSRILEHYVEALRLWSSDEVSVGEGEIHLSGERVELVDLRDDFVCEPGRISAKAGRQAGLAIEQAIRLVQSNRADAIVTAPISKAALAEAGYPYRGHTEFLADKTGTPDVLMMLLSGAFRVALATTHCPLAEVASHLDRQLLINKIEILFQDLKIRFGLKSPQIAVAALNPHAGEEGLLGREEIDVISPAIEFCRNRDIDVSGPYPADTLFASHDAKPYDAYLAMYHDQGLIPLKLRAFGRAVNYTAGLRFIRTSPDHGTAFDIAGKGRARGDSMKEAVRLAIELAAT